jgi:iron complex transport system ATP-binding protein
VLKINNYSNYILKNISLELQKDQNLIILGSNGAGKTTLAKAICGLIESDHIFIDEKNPSELYGEERTELINYIPPKLEIFDEFLSVYEYLELNNLYSTKSIDEVLSELCILHLKDKSCNTLSSGESQLLLLAGALLHHSSYTIFDEITANLDPIRLKEVFNILKSEEYLNSKIVITHNLHFAYKLGFDILYIQNGEAKFIGKNKDFFTQENLDKFFDGNVKRSENGVLIDL